MLMTCVVKVTIVTGCNIRYDCGQISGRLKMGYLRWFHLYDDSDMIITEKDIGMILVLENPHDDCGKKITTRF